MLLTFNYLCKSAIAISQISDLKEFNENLCSLKGKGVMCICL